MNTFVNGRRNPVAQLLLTLLAEIARMESETLSERINSGLENAKRKGKILGRPSNSKLNDQELLFKYKSVVKELKNGLSIRKVAKLQEVSPATVQKVKALLK